MKLKKMMVVVIMLLFVSVVVLLHAKHGNFYARPIFSKNVSGIGQRWRWASFLAHYMDTNNTVIIRQ